MSQSTDLVGWKRTMAALAVSGLAVLPTHEALGRAAALKSVASSPAPYLLAEHATLLYVLVPVAVLTASVLLLTPGLLLAVMLGQATTVASWITSGLLCSLVVVSAVAGLATAIAGAPVMGSSFALLVLGLSLLLGLVADRLVRSGRRRPPVFAGDDRLMLAIMLALALLTYWLMSPKFLWEDLNGDGAHAFEASRLLMRRLLPLWPGDTGLLNGFPGITSMLFAFPNAWYLRLFGELDVAARVPFLLYLPLLFAALMAIAARDGRRILPVTQAAVAVGLLSYSYAMAYSATYSPYSADIALPATQDTLLVICFLAAADAYWRREWGWLALAAALTYISLPSGLILLGFLLGGDLLIARPVPWRQGARLAATILGCAVGAVIVPPLIVALGGPHAGKEYGLVGILKYFAFLQFTDWTRLVLVAVPAGIFPVVAMWRWSVLDRPARVLVLVTVAYFLFFFVQAHVSLHHFVPAMLLPVAVALRALSREPSVARRWSLAWLAAAVVATLFSLPRSFRIQRDASSVASAMSVDVGDYSTSDTEVFRHSTLLITLFPLDWDPRVPFAEYGGAPVVWNRYAWHGPATATSNYAIVREGSAAPAGMHRVDADSGAVLYVRDDARWAADRARRPLTPAGSATYFIPRSILFRSVPNTDGPPILDVVATLERMGINMSPVLDRLGVKR